MIYIVSFLISLRIVLEVLFPRLFIINSIIANYYKI